MKKIKLFADGLKINELDDDFGIDIDGYTFNPSIFKKHGVKDYIEHSKKLLPKCKNKPVSFEVFADDEKEMIKQAKILNNLGNNIYSMEKCDMRGILRWIFVVVAQRVFFLHRLKRYNS